MKRISFSMLAVAGLLLTACADKDVISEGGGAQGEVLSKGYMALNIDLPTASASSTRAANDDFDDGDSKEYNVNNCALLLFQGTTEADATLLSVETFGSPDTDSKWSKDEDADNDNITTSYIIKTAVSGLDQNKNLYALAILNYTNYLETKSGNEDGYQLKNIVDESSTTVGNIQTKTVVLKTGADNPTTWSEICKYTIQHNVTNLTGADQNSFLMSNAVMSTAKGGNATKMPITNDIFQLATLDKSKIYNTADKAAADPAGEILVERAVAKATLSLASSAQNSTLNKGELTISEVKWAIDNIEPTTYVFRFPGAASESSNIPTFDYIGYTSGKFTNNYYRFVGEASTASNTNWGTTKDYYRTYWCVDPQYSDKNMSVPQDEESSDKNSVGMVPATSFGPVSTLEKSNPQYCTENTFDVKHQTYRNTTRAIIEVAFTCTGEDFTNSTNEFCIINGNKDVLYTTEAAKTHLIKRFTDNADFNTLLDNNLNEKDGIGINWEDGDFDKIFDYEFDRDDDTGILSMISLSLKTGDNTDTEGVIGDDKLFKTGTNIQTDLDNIRKLVNANLVILQYTEGKMYYEARFMHFASDDPKADLAPWGTWEEGAGKDKPTSSEPYPGSDDEKAQNYLGRYGMVRNNWYDVEVTAFKNLGSPVNPAGKIEKDDTPDDHIEDNIAVKIHVLSWAKRKQSWSF